MKLFAITIMVGVSLLLTTPASGEAGKAVFDIGCLISHSASDDPIVHQGMPGMSHLHDFAGNIATDAFSTGHSLLAGIEADPNASNCAEGGGIKHQNGSAYWFAAMWWNGVRVIPNQIHIYYRNASGRPDVVPFPTDWRMIVGDPSRDKEYQRQRLHWMCGGKDFLDVIREDCRGLRAVELQLLSPPCWNGDLDSFDHRAHGVYPKDNGRSGCPTSHPLHLPRLTIHVQYPVADAIGRTINPDTDSFKLGTLGEPGMELDMWQAHGDIMSAWIPPRLKLLIDFCLNARHDCKKDPPPDLPPADAHDR